LMDMMNDNEIEGVLGHELGHVALGHSLAEMKASYAIVAARDAISATSGVASQLSRSQLGDIAEGAINAKYSRDKESEADDFSFDLLKKRGISTQGLVGSFEKLASLDGGRTQSMFDSHPPSTERAQHIRDRIASGK
ncbi:metalloprotease, partial [Escherichia coli]|nr:metalloprotease [Escherichia coli]